MSHEEQIVQIFSRLKEIFILENFQFKIMRRQIDEEGRGVLNLKRSYRLAHTSLKNKTITVDIYTPRFRKPKSIRSILNILAHEIAHHQKLPFRQRFRGRIITRQHYPAFYEQVNKNIEKIKRDEILKEYFK
ncbi:hypothetical protein COT27_01885 [Candidatus Kuenenbacteria bacterium CG08_land_8_20_14_0_20_37_23]|uniref:SprT-like domain-containing protein n=2 Tax=Candidatus Kueneniibacteriota TaxID=1752740 RepID=A0A2M6XSU5_9BACT|nr:MAG: hypothetical protein AUJ29_03285 [Candidatus Kuenenbacteria bacterium CG1_02_38_13]PIU10661.1 MAG: hypothetical protein COT27_01885 [Candidatus Kuenenbacteria bacterium CG08_land_8_20_14_0_20_37_23]